MGWATCWRFWTNSSGHTLLAVQFCSHFVGLLLTFLCSWWLHLKPSFATIQRHVFSANFIRLVNGAFSSRFFSPRNKYFSSVCPQHINVSEAHLCSTKEGTFLRFLSYKNLRLLKILVCCITNAEQNVLEQCKKFHKIVGSHFKWYLMYICLLYIGFLMFF
jgi:hypothetical protein